MIERCRVNRGPVYWFNSSTVPSGKITVKLPENTKRAPRNVWGRHKALFWHLGMEIIVSSPDGLVLTLSPHILFTKDSLGKPLDDDPNRDYKKQQKLRRAIAKLWFNDKWRGFYYPFLAHVQERDGTVRVDIQGNSPMVFAGALSTISVPVTHSPVEALIPDDTLEPSDEDADE